MAILMGFAVRVVFTHTMSESYVGLNGLFMDILNVLSVSELGIETAITFALYRPIATGDFEKQKSLMNIYMKYYRIVACMVIGFGVLVFPFMDILIKNKSDIDQINLIYFLYLINSAFSYLLIYKKTIIDAHQKLYIGTLYQTSFWVIQDIVQIVVLLTTHNFILFLLVIIACSVVSNLLIYSHADRLFPYLKDKNVRNLSVESRKGIFKNVKAMIFHKIGKIMVTSTDNIVLSSFVGIVSVGYYSNYYLVIKSVSQVLDQMFIGITASIGNLGATENSEKVKEVLNTSFFIAQWVYGIAGLCLFELINFFVNISFGANYVLNENIVLVLCINFYLSGIKDSVLVFRDSLGLFWNDRFVSISEAVLNLILSIILVQRFGMIGVFIGNVISIMVLSAWLEPYLIYKKYLKAKSNDFFIRYILYIFVMAAIWFATNFVCQLLGGTSIITFIEKLIICITLPNILIIAVFFRTKEFKYLLKKIKGANIRSIISLRGG